jgi:DNA invertase Pin-like site-specific DNA recombinase
MTENARKSAPQTRVRMFVVRQAIGPNHRMFVSKNCPHIIFIELEIDGASGRWDRPELHRMLDQLREGDVVVVWKLDRLSRSLKDVLHIMERIGAVSAGFRSLTEAIDTTTPVGRMMI